MRATNLLGFLALLAATSAQASNWVLVGADQNGSTYYIDKASLKVVGGFHRFWQKQDATADKTMHEAQVLDLWELDCAGGRTRVLTSTFYMADGATRTQDYPDIMKWNAVVPDSIGDTELQMVCGKTP